MCENLFAKCQLFIVDVAINYLLVVNRFRYNKIIKIESRCYGNLNKQDEVMFFFRSVILFHHLRLFQRWSHPINQGYLLFSKMHSRSPYTQSLAARPSSNNLYLCTRTTAYILHTNIKYEYNSPSDWAIRRTQKTVLTYRKQNTGVHKTHLFTVHKVRVIRWCKMWKNAPGVN